MKITNGNFQIIADMLLIDKKRRKTRRHNKIIEMLD